NPNSTSVDFNQITTPEIYLGYGFARQPLGNPEGFKQDQTVTYSLPSGGTSGVVDNTVYLSGAWKNNNDNMELSNYAGEIVLKYSAKSVNIVAGGKGEVHVSQDGKPLDSHSMGTDVNASGGSFAINGQRLYNVVTNDNYGTHTVVLDITGPGFQI